MKTSMNKPTKLALATSIAATVALSAVSAPAFSANSLANSQVWTTSNGSSIVTSNGNPVRTIHFKETRRVSKLNQVKLKPVVVIEPEIKVIEEPVEEPVEELKVEPIVEPVVKAEAVVLAPKPIKPEPVAPIKVEYTFNNYDATILFDTASSTLSADATASLNQLSMATASAESILSVQVVGHADSRGDESYNMTLSEQRMHSVANYLKGLKFKVTSMFAQGESKPVLGTKGENLEQSRRVHVAVKTRRVTD